MDMPYENGYFDQPKDLDSDSRSDIQTHSL